MLRRRCETMAALVGHLVTVTQPKGDALFQVRRRGGRLDAARLG
jgi:hypothetical protein